STCDPLSLHDALPILRVGVSAATDVTGFGLPGHLRNMLRASGVSATIYADRIPMLPGADALAIAGCIAGGTRRNLEDLAGDVARSEEHTSELQSREKL